MNPSDRILHQRHKEQKALKLFLLCSVLGSLVAHGMTMTVRVGNIWNPAASTSDDDMEVVVEDAPDAPPTAEKSVTEPEEPPTAVATVEEVAISSQLAPAPIPLAPDSQAPLPVGQDAPSKAAPAPKADPITPLTNPTGTTPVQSGGSGPVTNPEGQGSGFDFSRLIRGFNLDGKPTGKPEGRPDGQPEGKPGGVPNGQPGGQVGGPNGKPNETATRSTPPQPDRAPKPVCLECPKPKYRDSEGSPRVTYDIGPDGRVTNVRLRQSSGNPNLDRETLETLSKWRFDPKTVPGGGRQNVRVRVTFEEEGSTYQRQNEQRRQETQRRQVVQEQPPPAAAPRQPTTATNQSPAKPTSAPVSTPSSSVERPTSAPPLVEPAPPPPAPTPVAPALVEPTPVPVAPAPSAPEQAPAPASSPAPANPSTPAN